jgi:YebC/PmpR family DNA-binding regulatory protein
MSGHSKWSTIKHKKGITDAKRGKIFTKLLKEIAVATKMGDPNPEFNPRLRSAIIAAKAVSMPKANIDSTIKKATFGSSGESWEEIKYEGYGPNGVAIIVEALTDNKNRTASSVRANFSKNGGNMGESGSVSFMFEKVGIISFEGKVATEDQILEVAIEAGAEEVDSLAELHEITTKVEIFIKVRDFLMAKYGEPLEAKLSWIAKESIIINDKEKAEKINNLIEALEDNEDVQNVYGNYEFTEEIMNSL